MSRFAYIPSDFSKIEDKLNNETFAENLDREMFIDKKDINHIDLYIIDDYKIPVKATNKNIVSITNYNTILNDTKNHAYNIKESYYNFWKKYGRKIVAYNDTANTNNLGTKVTETDNINTSIYKSLEACSKIDEVLARYDYNEEVKNKIKKYIQKINGKSKEYYEKIIKVLKEKYLENIFKVEKPILEELLLKFNLYYSTFETYLNSLYVIVQSSISIINNKLNYNDFKIFSGKYEYGYYSKRITKWTETESIGGKTTKTYYVSYRYQVQTNSSSGDWRTNRDEPPADDVEEAGEYWTGDNVSGGISSEDIENWWNEFGYLIDSDFDGFDYDKINGFCGCLNPLGGEYYDSLLDDDSGLYPDNDTGNPDWEWNGDDWMWWCYNSPNSKLEQVEAHWLDDNIVGYTSTTSSGGTTYHYYRTGYWTMSKQVYIDTQEDITKYYKRTELKDVKGYIDFNKDKAVNTVEKNDVSDVTEEISEEEYDNLNTD